ncbi:hypothetical protein Q1695_013552 [Nippostrongylus brasiliensis]|nr:hypothetical protein Q1695_013552 [Nippostrongylus brasiliensis]
MVFTSVRYVEIGLLIIIAFWSTPGRACKAVTPGNDIPDDDRPWYVTSVSDWNASDYYNLSRGGVKLKAYKQPSMNFDEAKALCRRYGANVADIFWMRLPKFHKLFPVRAWNLREGWDGCFMTEAQSGLTKQTSCDARADFVICERWGPGVKLPLSIISQRNDAKSRPQP